MDLTLTSRTMAADDAALYREYQQLDRQYVETYDELEAIFEEFGVEDLDGLRRLAQDLPDDAAEARRLFDEIDRLDAEGDYVSDPTPEMDRLNAQLETILQKYGTEDVDYLVHLTSEIGGELRNAEDLSKSIDELAAAKRAVQDQMEWTD